LKYLLDTSIAIHAGAAHSNVLKKFVEHAGGLFMSALVLTELHRGFYKNIAHRDVRRMQLDILLRQVGVLDFDTAAAEAYGRIIAALGWTKGRDFDRMIAAHAISTHSILVTANEKDFRDIPGLKLENWLTAA
jgi:tRNA(fMet)-specific endonuclease VapC